MENNIFICVDSHPTSLKRHKSRRVPFGIQTYDPQRDLKKTVLKSVLEQIPENFQPFGIPVELIIEFHMPIPASWSKVKGRRHVYEAHCSKPDLSNLIKFYEDVFNGVLYLDDSLICGIQSTKIYSYAPKTLICVREYIREVSEIHRFVKGFG